ncbi:PhaM family polyhydroxyalkanoate granule multifunctional regulatory protein [Pollutimonas bauzanensis]|jgi:hypothetical protein|uniref:PhaM family polyhydroxyalkanoate granule multifunctional regulatory protein n=1 Tax=Pollutimonas bauzanensis TaxID=658167 RepID=UPI0033425E1F
MVTQNDNPFVLPGFGQSGDMAQNPLVASMEMMRQAWEGLAGSGGLNQAAMATPMSVEELERRIGDLRAVENWLRMNLSMLSSTIQGLEVQRSTIATLKSFMASASAEQPATAGAQDIAANAATAAQGWWDMVQKQFDSLAEATAASLKGAEAAASQQASADSTMGARPAATARKAATKSAAPAKPAAKKTAPRKRAAPARNKT